MELLPHPLTILHRMNQHKPTEGERVLASQIASQALEVAALVNALARSDERLAHLDAAYQEVREILTPKQREQLGIEE